MLSLSLAPASRAEDVTTARPLLVSFHIDLLGDRAEGEMQHVDAPTAKPMEFSLIGIPLTFGESVDPDDSRMGLEAGVRADYATTLGSHLSLTASAGLAKAGYADNSWGSDKAGASVRLRYEHEGWAVAFEPAWRIDMVETIVTRSDHGATISFAKPLPQGLSMSGGLRYGRHDAPASADDYTAATAFAALSYRLGEWTTLDLFYDTAYKQPDAGKAGTLSFDDLRYAENRSGPSIAMTLVIWETVDVSAIYRYCRVTDDLPRYASTADRRVEDVKSFDLTASWHSNDPTYSGINLTAAYDYERTSSSLSETVESSHAATLALAVPF